MKLTPFAALACAFATPALAQTAPTQMSQCPGSDMSVEAFQAQPAEKRHSALACILRANQTVLSATLPMKVDGATTLRTVTAEGVTLRYDYSVAIPLANITPAMKQAVSDATRAKVCSESSMRTMLAAGARYAYRWRTEKNELISEMVVSGC